MGVVAETGGQLDLHGRRPPVVGGQRVDGVDAGRGAEIVEHRVVDRGPVDHGHDVAAAGVELVEEAVDPFGLERRGTVEVGVERREEHAGGADPDDEDDEPHGGEAPWGPEGQVGQSRQHAPSVRPWPCRGRRAAG